MAKQQLRIIYSGPGDGPHIDVELEVALEKTLAEFGFERWASGCDLVLPFERDLAFQRTVGVPSAGELTALCAEDSQDVSERAHHAAPA